MKSDVGDWRVWEQRLVVHCSRLLNHPVSIMQRKRYGHGGRVHEIKITDTAEITIAGTNPNPEP